MKLVYVLGNGQLGRMLRQAGEKLGFTVYPIGLDADPKTLLVAECVITAESEEWPVTESTRVLSKHSAFVNRDIFPILADRLTQKQLINKLGISTAPWQQLMCTKQWKQIFSSFGKLVIVKKRIGGYDGRGQWQICADKENILPHGCYGKSIVEKIVHFSSEMSLVGARGYDGSMVFYPLTYNFHQDGVLRVSVMLLDRHTQQKQAEYMLSMIMRELNYVGVMTMECFVGPEGLVVNEIAPRVHNSGHWTQDAASISQFELHLRAILNLPLPTPVINMPAVMLNLIGIDACMAWLIEPRVHLHWYNKKVRFGRKVGHLNLVDISTSAISQALSTLGPLLPSEYMRAISWAQRKLKSD
ncbi:5-(carboxyamino)imidazole ribonucleotide synthase [Candidatus Erwinia haradaeae]|uniref:N5-carboxyaminoimidazole ribonucleotide synthase n=1 Tax=Candidatus Erwinia haradaeae TaxID=1922217 RepID=A0A451DA35_9GAMM|nr:5-(carboxyamino)imidazole ribonucleotide synthase [Candidatus Erwinia haradaeae]VFP83101.1 N5-carboxyaminoimidazole ribonucleotide synthase [Candidatus Erwinia haradaeae]